MNNRRDILIGVLTALCITVIINAPMIRAIITSNEWRFQDIVQESSDEAFYLARIKEVADGHPFIGQPYVFERREQIYPLGQLFEWIQGTTMRILNMKLKSIVFFFDLLSPFLLSFLLWIAARSMLPQQRWRLLLLALLFLGSAIPGWKRPISPQAITLLPLLFLWGVWTPRRSQPATAALRSGLIGLMLYSYPYHWTYCLITEILLLGSDLLQEKVTRKRWHRLLSFLLPVGILSIPWIGMNFAISDNAVYHELLLRLGLQASHLPTGPQWQVRILIVLVFLFLAIRLSKQKNLWGTLGLPLIAGLLVFNQTIFTGSELEFSSHYSRFLHVPLWAGFLVSSTLLLKRFPTADRIAAYGGLSVVLLSTIFVTQSEQRMLQTITPPAQQRAQRETLMEALNSLPGEQVILTDLTMSQDITLYTRHYPFFAPQTHMYLLPDAEVQRRAALQSLLFPDEPLSPRAVYGSSYLNRALNERARCKVYDWIGKANATNCTKTAEEYLPSSWPAIRDGTTSDSKNVLDILRESHVSFALLRAISPLIQDALIPVATVNDYRLYEVRL